VETLETIFTNEIVSNTFPFAGMRHYCRQRPAIIEMLKTSAVFLILVFRWYRIYSLGHLPMRQVRA
ncbi:MAG: hypothetical protein IIY99_01525, partial [Firmicutes bacterium]|nr:hypothetical protein [Bacillota bacterium]